MRPLLLLALCAAAAGCGRSRQDGPLRLGYFPNITHAQALVGIDEGIFAAALGGRLEPRMFTSGPSAMESLVAGDIDVAYVGPGPAVNAFLRTEGSALRVVAGASSGGAVLVVRDARGPGDLAGKRVATPGLGNTQDVALRTWLRSHGVSDRGGPRGVEVTPLPGPDILQLFARGDLAGAWVAEPWGARLVAQAGARILLDERSLWPGGEFPTAVLAVSTVALARRRADVLALVRAHAELTRRWREDEAGFAARANEAYARRTSRRLAPEVVRDAFSRVTPTLDPMPELLAEMAHRAQALGLAPPGDVSGLVDGTLLEDLSRRGGRTAAALAARAAPPRTPREATAPRRPGVLRVQDRDRAPPGRCPGWSSPRCCTRNGRFPGSETLAAMEENQDRGLEFRTGAATIAVDPASGTVEVREGPFRRILSYDQALLLGMRRFHGPVRTAVARAFTRMGDGSSWTALGIACLASFTARGTHLGLRIGAATGIATLLSQSLKRSLTRPRPDVSISGFEALAANPDRFSFPSGHTAAAFAVAVAFIGEPRGLGPLALLLAVGIALSRVYLGAHYPLDVAAGAVLGVFGGLAARLLVA